MVETEIFNPHESLMAAMESNAARAKQESSTTDTGQNAPETTVVEEKVEKPIEKPIEKKVEKEAKVEKEVEEKPKKEKFWKSKEVAQTETPAQTNDYEAKYKELETNYSKVKQDYESKLKDYESKIESEQYKQFLEIQKNGTVDDILSELATGNPSKKTYNELVRDMTIRSLSKKYTAEELNDDLIESEIEKLDTLPSVMVDGMAEAEKKIQLDQWNSTKEKFKSQGSKEAESFAKDLIDTHSNIVGKELYGLPVTKDRQQRMDAKLEAYSKSGKMDAQELYKALFFLEHEAEIFDNVIESYGNSKVEETIAKVKGSEIRMGNTRTTNSGEVKTPEQEHYEALINSVGTTVRMLEEHGSKQQTNNNK